MMDIDFTGALIACIAIGIFAGMLIVGLVALLIWWLGLWWGIGAAVGLCAMPSIFALGWNRGRR